MAALNLAQATALAEAFLRARRGRAPVGALTSVGHVPARAGHEGAGEYHVEFAYAGPPVRRKANPPRDHPTVVIVNDETGACSLMLWM